MEELTVKLDTVWVLFSACLVFLMQAGFTMVETGYVRAKNSVNIAMKNVLDFIIATMFFYFIGFQIMFGDEKITLYGIDFWILKTLDEPQDMTMFIFQLMFAGTAATIVSGAVAERMSFRGYAIISVMITAIIYPVSGHWVWNPNGWLSEMGYIDFAGSSVVHLLGATVGLVGTMMIGVRHGRFDEFGRPNPIPHFNLTLVTLGIFLLWFGWFGFNGGSTLKANDQIPLIIINTIIAGAFGGFGAFLISLYTEKQASVSKMLNGILGGLVGITAACAFVEPFDSAIIGLISGVLVCIAEDYLLKLKIDDPVGAIPVHGVCGLFGVVAFGIFAGAEHLPVGDRLMQIVAQLLGAGAIIIWSGLSAFFVFYALKKLNYLRVPLEDEIIGLNIAEHGVKMGWFETLKVMHDIIHEGDYSKRVDVEHQTEAGEVAENFNKLLDDLEGKIGVINSVSQGELNEAGLYRPKGASDVLGSSIVRMIGNLKEMMSALNQKSDELEVFNTHLEKIVQDRTLELKVKSEKVADLLNSSGQGFLSFDQKGEVGSEYSLECENIFGSNISGSNIVELLYPTDKMKREALSDGINMVFESTDDFQQELLISLIDSEFVINDKTIKAQYKLPKDGKIMTILTDITEQRILEEKVKQEKSLLQFIVSVIKEKKQFFDAYDEFVSYIGAVSGTKELTSQNATTMYRKVHTYKGVFAQFDMPTLPKILHEIEGMIWRKIVTSQESGEAIIIDKTVFDAIDEGLKSDMEYLGENLGADFINSKDDVVIPKEFVETLDALGRALSKKIDPSRIDSTLKQGLNILAKLHNVSFKSLLHPYPKLCYQLASRLEKEVEPFEIEGDDFLVEPKQYIEFTKALVHIFRNACDHGIETIDERVLLEKSEIAHISCHIKATEDTITIEIKDDGRGIDPEKVKESALKKGLYSKDRLDKMEQHEVFNIIFEDGFSTKDDVTDISGRGIGLAALKEETQNLGGRIEIESILGEGTCFRFVIPK